MTKLHKKKANIFGKKVPVLLLALVLVAGIGSAALLSFYGTITGSATVDQSVTFGNGDKEKTFSFDGETFSAGKTYSDSYILKNGASVPAEIEFEKTQNKKGTGSTEEDVEGIMTGIYEVQTYDLTSESSETTENDVKDYHVEVIPGVDEVTYRVHFEDGWEDRGAANADLQISPTHDSDEDNYHVKYSSDNHTSDGDYNWMFYLPSESKKTTVQGREDVLERDEVKDLKMNEDENYLEVTVSRETGVEQSFATWVHQAHEHSSDSWNSVKTDGASYDDSSVDSHQVPDFSEVSSLESGESTEISVSNRFDIALESGEYDVETKIVPAN